MVRRERSPGNAEDPRIAELERENAALRAEIRVTHEAAELTAQLVIEQFERNESVLGQLRNTSGRLQAVLDAASQVAIITTDLQGKVGLCNRGAHKMLGCDNSAVKGRQMSELLVSVAGMEEAIDSELLARLAVHCGAEACEALMRRQDGSDFSANLAVTALRDTNGGIGGYLAVAMDITALKQAEAQLQHSFEELQAANAHLQELDKLKSEFLSSVSHELRTPLTSIRGFAKLIGRDFERIFYPLAGEDPKLNRKATRISENLGIILSESERLTRLINDVLDLAKIESGRMSWSDEVLSLAGVIAQALNAAHGQFEAKPQVRLVTDVDDDLPPVVADRDRLIQVLVNLLNNAAKFTEQGTVTLRARRDEDGGARLEVIDTGVGFDPQQAEMIFDKFKQASHGDTLTDKPTGTGLGLSISREILRHYHGDIHATSSPGKGSVFTLSLPAAPVAEEAAYARLDETTLVDHGAPLILVVDDEPSVCRYLSQLFQEHGYRVVMAENGQIALEQARSHHPDLITMDLAMPIMDGRAAIQALRADPDLAQIPVIVVTALPNKETPGASAAFGKPIEEDKLLGGIRLLLGQSAAEASPATPCLIIYEGDRPPDQVPVFCGSFDYCPLEQLMERLRTGYKGVLVLPTQLLRKLDLEAIQSRSGSNLVILPLDEMMPCRSVGAPLEDAS